MCSTLEQRRAILIVHDAKRFQMAIAGRRPDVANHRDGLEARRSQPEYDRASCMSGSGGGEDRF
jgi:hypothetical protein